MSLQNIRIGGASGYWGDASHATSQLLDSANLDFIVYDYLAEITMSILARARARDPAKGYALDFVSTAMADNLSRIEQQGVKVISNAGGVNPQACAAAVQTLIDQGGHKLKVAYITGDDLIGRSSELAELAPLEMFSGESFPDTERLQSINAYLGAFPIAAALDAGADIVISGRCVDSAVTLATCIHSFSWHADQYDQLAMASLAGHILECGTQATGGNFTDWRKVADQIDKLGYPIVEVSSTGEFVCSKPDNTGGLVSFATIAEQMLYEIHDPQDYLLPDVSCDFSQVILEDIGSDRVAVKGAIGRAPGDSYKVCATYTDQYRGGTYLSYYGIDAEQKAQAQAEAIFRLSRSRFDQLGLEDFSETSVELIGNESQFGDYSELSGSREVAMKVAVKHPQQEGVAVMLKQASALALATPPGLSGFQGGRAKPSPVVRLFSFLLPKMFAELSINIDGKTRSFLPVSLVENEENDLQRPQLPPVPTSDHTVEVDLVDLAWGRSGDKGNIANVGIIARKADYLPWIWAALSESFVEQRYTHFIKRSEDNDSVAVERFYLPGIQAINFVVHDVLGGGGVASLRNDAQAKGYAQLLLTAKIPVSDVIAAEIRALKTSEQ